MSTNVNGTRRDLPEEGYDLPLYLAALCWLTCAGIFYLGLYVVGGWAWKLISTHLPI